MRGRAGQVEPVDRGLGASEAGQRPEDQLLVDACGSTADRATVQVRVDCFQIERSLDGPGQDQVAKARSSSLPPRRHPVASSPPRVTVNLENCVHRDSTAPAAALHLSPPSPAGAGRRGAAGNRRRPPH
jgi:hypothetical protein